MPVAIVVLVLAALWRVFVLYVPVLSNFSPVMALAFCAGAYGSNRWLRLAPFAALVLSDLYIDQYYLTVFHYQWSLGGELLRMACYLAALGFGVAISHRRNWVNLAGGALAGTVLFYLASNTASWMGDVAYRRDLAGWWQALTVGHPEYEPTLFFLRNSLVSDVLFTAAFALAMEYAALRRGNPSLLGLKQVRR